MNRGPELLGASESGAKNFTQEKNTPLLYIFRFLVKILCHSRLHAGFSIAGEVIYLAENTKSIKTLGAGGLHRFPDPVAGPRAPKPHLRSQHFGLPVLALGGRPRELSAPRLLLNQGPSEPCYATGIVWSIMYLLLKFHKIPSIASWVL